MTENIVAIYLLVSCFHSNILELTNTFNIPDMNITEKNYEAQLTYLNATHPHEVQKINLKTCNLQTLLDQVLLHT